MSRSVLHVQVHNQNATPIIVKSLHVDCSPLFDTPFQPQILQADQSCSSAFLIDSEAALSIAASIEWCALEDAVRQSLAVANFPDEMHHGQYLEWVFSEELISPESLRKAAWGLELHHLNTNVFCRDESHSTRRKLIDDLKTMLEQRFPFDPFDVHFTHQEVVEFDIATKRVCTPLVVPRSIADKVYMLAETLCLGIDRYRTATTCCRTSLPGTCFHRCHSCTIAVLVSLHECSCISIQL